MSDQRKLLAVIGTAGRQDDAALVNRALYDAMYQETLRTMNDWNVRVLVSGGAAVADHLAVRAFIEGETDGLVLHLPSPFVNGAFAGGAAPRDAVTCNRYHRQFSQSCGLDSLAELAQAIRLGADVHIGKGFKDRNLDVARDATHVLALTFGSNECSPDLTPDMPAFSDASLAGVKSGGTHHTFSSCWRAEIKRHVGLRGLAERVSVPKTEAPSIKI